MGGTREMVNSRVISHGKLRERLGGLVTGPVLGAGDPGYEESRRVFNAMIERRPAAILKCSCAEDVVHGVIAAREYDLPLSIKGGGHSVAGNAVCDGGLMLDMSSIKRIFDPGRGLAVAEAGLTLPASAPARYHPAAPRYRRPPPRARPSTASSAGRLPWMSARTATTAAGRAMPLLSAPGEVAVAGFSAGRTRPIAAPAARAVEPISCRSHAW